MIKQSHNEYLPDYVSSPGETLLETIEALGMSQAALAERTGRPKKTINEIINGKSSITPATALQLERVLGVPASFWNKRESDYREFLARKEEQENLKKQVEWLKKLPLKAMMKLGWIEASSDKVTQLQLVLNFFGVATPKEWDELWNGSRLAFRRSPSFKSDPGAVAAWLRKGELQGQSIVCSPFDEARFKEALQKAKDLTVTPLEDFRKELVRLCALAGVAVVFVPELPGTRTSGATRWLTTDKALIQLSLRYKTDDQLWFTFFHEAGHILMHGKSKVFLEDDSAKDGMEEEANHFAANLLIPESKLRQFTAKGERSLTAIQSFAHELGIAPGIVVGRLQHESYLPKSHCNGLKKRVE